jgi:hypothetical protein
MREVPTDGQIILPGFDQIATNFLGVMMLSIINTTSLNMSLDLRPLNIDCG